MANTFEQGGTARPVYNGGVLRVPGVGTEVDKTFGAPEGLFADLLEKDIVGGQVAKDFVGDVGTPLVNVAGKPGHYAKAAAALTTVDGLLLLAADAYDGPRQINVVKGASVKTTVGALRGLDAAKQEALATALGGKYDSVFKTIKF